MTHDSSLQESLAGIIRDAFFDARSAGQTMYQASDDAAARVLAHLDPASQRLQEGVEALLAQWEADRRGYPTDDWRAGIADLTVKLCTNELRNTLERALSPVPEQAGT